MTKDKRNRWNKPAHLARRHWVILVDDGGQDCNELLGIELSTVSIYESITDQQVVIAGHDVSFGLIGVKKEDWDLNRQTCQLPTYMNRLSKSVISGMIRMRGEEQKTSPIASYRPTCYVT